MNKPNMYDMHKLNAQIRSLSEENGLKLIYAWIRLNLISFEEFSEVIDSVNYGLKEDYDLSE